MVVGSNPTGSATFVALSYVILVDAEKQRTSENRGYIVDDQQAYVWFKQTVQVGQDQDPATRFSFA